MPHLLTDGHEYNVLDTMWTCDGFYSHCAWELKPAEPCCAKGERYGLADTSGRGGSLSPQRREYTQLDQSSSLYWIYRDTERREQHTRKTIGMGPVFVSGAIHEDPYAEQFNMANGARTV